MKHSNIPKVQNAELHPGVRFGTAVEEVLIDRWLNSQLEEEIEKMRMLLEERLAQIEANALKELLSGWGEN